MFLKAIRMNKSTEVEITGVPVHSLYTYDLTNNP